MSHEHQSCLILNQDYTPLDIISWQRAICLEIIGKDIPGEGVRVIEYYDDVVISAGGEEFDIPAVAVCNHYVKRSRKIPAKKRHLLIRDKKKCQYCMKELTPKSATIDHIKPKYLFKKEGLSEMAAHTWKNITLACQRCNAIKRNRTPEQAGMKLLSEPYEPDATLFYTNQSPWRTIPKEWETYVRR